MTQTSIARLDHTNHSVAAAIWRIMQAAYRVEADLLGIDQFPPLNRSSAAIAASGSTFCGLSRNHRLAAVIETETGHGPTLDIASLVVAPQHVRKGFGSALVREVIARHQDRDITVSTAAANRPAIRLYTGLGFRGGQAWQTADGHDMVTFLRAASPPSGP